MGPDAIAFLDACSPLYPPLDADGLVNALTRRRAIHRAWSQFFQQTPLIVTPIWTQPPFAHSWNLTHAPETMELMCPVMPANLLGLPAAAVPAGQAGGLPAGIQVIGERFQELACLQAAEAIERALSQLTPIDPVLDTASA
jgi:amidase